MTTLNSPTPYDYTYTSVGTIYMSSSFGHITALSFSPRGTFVAAGSSEGNLRISPTFSNELHAVNNLNVKFSSAITSLVWHPDPSRLVLYIGELNGHVHRVLCSMVNGNIGTLSSSSFLETVGEGQQYPVNALAVDWDLQVLIMASGSTINFLALDQTGPRVLPRTTLTVPLQPVLDAQPPCVTGLKVVKSGGTTVLIIGFLEHGIHAYTVAFHYQLNTLYCSPFWGTRERRGHYFGSWDVLSGDSGTFLIVAHNICDGLEYYRRDGNSHTSADYRSDRFTPVQLLSSENYICPVAFVHNGDKVVYGTDGGSVLIVASKGRYQIDVEIPRIVHQGDHHQESRPPTIATWFDDDRGVEYLATGTLSSVTVYQHWEPLSESSTTTTEVPLQPGTPIQSYRELVTPQLNTAEPSLSPQVPPQLNQEQPRVLSHSDQEQTPSALPIHPDQEQTPALPQRPDQISPALPLRPNQEQMSPAVPPRQTSPSRYSESSVHVTKADVLSTIFIILATVGTTVFIVYHFNIPYISTYLSRSSDKVIAETRYEESSNSRPTSMEAIVYTSTTHNHLDIAVPTKIMEYISLPPRETTITLEVNPTTVTNYDIDSFFARPEWQHIATLLSQAISQPPAASETIPSPNPSQSNSAFGWVGNVVFVFSIASSGIVGFVLGRTADQIWNRLKKSLWPLSFFREAGGGENRGIDAQR